MDEFQSDGQGVRVAAKNFLYQEEEGYIASSLLSYANDPAGVCAHRLVIGYFYPGVRGGRKEDSVFCSLCWNKIKIPIRFGIDYQHDTIHHHRCQLQSALGSGK